MAVYSIDYIPKPMIMSKSERFAMPDVMAHIGLFGRPTTETLIQKNLVEGSRRAWVSAE